MLTIFLFIAILVLALSSINYLNYVVSVQYSKLKETGIYKTVGAGWKQLVSYSITEVTTGIMLSVIISGLLTILLLPSAGALFGKQLHIQSLDILKLLPVFFGVFTRFTSPGYFLTYFLTTSLELSVEQSFTTIIFFNSE